MLILKSKYDYDFNEDWALEAGEIYIGIEVSDKYLIRNTFYPKDFFEVISEVSESEG